MAAWMLSKSQPLAQTVHSAASAATGNGALMSVLPNRQAWQLSRLEPYGMWILIALMFTGLLSLLMNPLIKASYRFLNALI